MSDRFDPKAYRALTIDGYDVADGAFAAHYTLRGLDPSDDVSFTERVDFGTALPKPPDDRLLRLLALTCCRATTRPLPRHASKSPFRPSNSSVPTSANSSRAGSASSPTAIDLPGALAPDVTGPQAPRGLRSRRRRRLGRRRAPRWYPSAAARTRW